MSNVNPDWVRQMQADSAQRQRGFNESMLKGVAAWGAVKAAGTYKAYKRYQAALMAAGYVATLPRFQVWEAQESALRESQPGRWFWKREPSQAAVAEIWAQHIEIIARDNGGTK